MVNRKHLTIEQAMARGMIERPQHTYGLNENKNFYQYMWKEEEIMGLLEYLSSVHRGRPRKDGMITISDLPTPRELRAMINDDQVLYVKQGDTYVPTWRAKEF
jgi:erythromycin esterase-like protein